MYENDKAPWPAGATELYRFGKEKDMKGRYYQIFLRSIITKVTAASQNIWKAIRIYIPRSLMFPVKRKRVTTINPRIMPIISISAAAKEDCLMIPQQLRRSERAKRLPL